MFGIRKRSRTDGSSAPHDAPTTTAEHRRNLAGRMGRWSAAHWKTATFGWVASSSSHSGSAGMVGMKTIDPNVSGPGESGRMDRILEAGFKQPAGESVLIQSRSLRTSDPAFRAAIEDVVPGVSALNVVQHVRSPLEPGNAGQIAKDGHAALVELQIRGDAGQGQREDRRGRRPRRRGTAGPPAALHRRVRQRQRGQRVGHRVRRGPREGGAALAADHVDHPRGRVRGARRGGHSAAPRPDRRVRDVRAWCRRQPGDAARRGVERARPADRARRRRRLLDVLLEARTRGTRRRTQRTGCDRGRRRDLGALRARLRPDRDGRDGGPVPDRRRDLRLVRPCDDDGRRDRRCWAR